MAGEQQLWGALVKGLTKKIEVPKFSTSASLHQLGRLHRPPPLDAAHRPAEAMRVGGLPMDARTKALAVTRPPPPGSTPRRRSLTSRTISPPPPTRPCARSRNTWPTFPDTPSTNTSNGTADLLAPSPLASPPWGLSPKASTAVATSGGKRSQPTGYQPWSWPRLIRSGARDAAEFP